MKYLILFLLVGCATTGKKHGKYYLDLDTDFEVLTSYIRDEDGIPFSKCYWISSGTYLGCFDNVFKYNRLKKLHEENKVIDKHPIGEIHSI